MGRRTLGACCGLGVLAWLFAAEQGNAEPAHLRLVADVWPPFTDAEGKPREALDLVESALLRSGRKAQFSILSWSDALARLDREEADGVVAMWKTPEREAHLLFSEPYLENRLVLVARKGSDVSASSIAQLTGKRLVLTRGYGYGDAVVQPDVHIVLRENDTECLRAVLAGEADYLLLDQLMVEHLFRFYSAKAEQLIVAGSTPLLRHPLHFAVRRSYPEAARLISDFNRSIERMQADGTYNVLLHIPWIRRRDARGGVEYVASSKGPSGSQTAPTSEHGSYEVVTPAVRPAGKGSPEPGYRIDGKSYNTWGDAATTLERSGSSTRDGVYEYSTGFVLGSF